jgi:uncharacterized protein (TIGR00645 family)
MPSSTAKPAAERVLETALLRARWLMAPFYVGLVLALLVLLTVFVMKIAKALPRVFEMTAEDAILLSLSLIDLSLAANLLLIVIFSGYENFVSKFHVEHEDQPDWMSKVDFSGLKMKLMASIVAISAIALLGTFLRLVEGEHIDTVQVAWAAAIQLTFVVSALLLAAMDWLVSRTGSH